MHFGRDVGAEIKQIRVHLFAYICRSIYFFNFIFYLLLLLFFFAVALRPNAGHDLLILEVFRSHATTHHIW
jgi:hypothetical protein